MIIAIKNNFEKLFVEFKVDEIVDNLDIRKCLDTSKCCEFCDWETIYSFIRRY